MGNYFTVPTVTYDWKKTLAAREEEQRRNALNGTVDAKNKVEPIPHLRPSDVKGWAYWCFCTLLLAFLVILTLIRITEIIAYVCDSIIFTVMFGAVFLAATSLFFAPPKTVSLALRRLTVIVMVLISFKRDIDLELGKGLISASADEGGMYDLRNRVVIVTGASSGVGRGMCELFASYGATVIMACRSADRCQRARDDIYRALSSRIAYVGPLVPMVLDLADLNSVHDFSKSILESYKHVDILVNNAGSVPLPGERTAQGLEMAWGSMHVGHFALTQWLLPALLAPVGDRHLSGSGSGSGSGSNSGGAGGRHFRAEQEAEFASSAARIQATPGNIAGLQMKALATYGISDSSRVVYVASEAMLAGSFHSSLIHGNGTGLGDLHGEMVDNCGFTEWGLPCCPIGRCPDTNSYARSKLSNVLSAYELQKRVDVYAAAQPEGKVRRLVASSLHPGAVATNIHPLFSHHLTNWGMRSHVQAARLVVYAALENTFVPGSYVDAMSKPHDLFRYFASGSRRTAAPAAAAAAADATAAAAGVGVHFSAWPEAKKLPFFQAAKNELYDVDRTPLNAAPPAGVGNPSLPRWALRAKTFQHTGGSGSGSGSAAAAILAFALKAVGKVEYRAIEILSAVDFLGVLSARRAALEEAEQDMLTAAWQEQLTVSARLWEVTDRMLHVFETHKRTGQKDGQGGESMFAADSMREVEASSSAAGLRLRLLTE